MRNVGVAIAHALVAYQSMMKGLHKVDLNQSVIEKDLQANWAILAEAIQTIMRRYGLEQPYEQLKNLTRGKK